MTENFTTYTEVDPSGHLAETASRVTWAGLNRNEDCYLYKDFGAAYFSGSFTFLFALKPTVTSIYGDYLSALSLANLIDDWKGIDDAGGDGLTIRYLSNSSTTIRIAAQELVAGSPYTGSDIILTVGTEYYLKFVRNEKVGTFGTLYLYVYTDAARTILLGTSSVTLHAANDFRYLFVPQSFNDGFNFSVSGYAEDLTLRIGLGPMAGLNPALVELLTGV